MDKTNNPSAQETIKSLLTLTANLEAESATKDETISQLKRSIAAYKANSTRRKALRNQGA